MALRFRPRGGEPAPADLPDDAPVQRTAGRTTERVHPPAGERAAEQTPTSGTSDDGSDATPDSPADLPKPSLVAVLKRARTEFKADHLTDLAAALTYYGVLSIVPALIVLLSILGLLGQGATDQVVSQVEAVAPGSAADFVKTLITQAQANRTGAGLGAIFGVLIALWSASGYVAAFMRASNVIYDIGEGRPIWKTLPIRVGVTVFAVIVLVVSAIIVVVSGPVARQLGDVIGVGDTTVLLWSILKWPVLVVLISVLLAVLFWASPNARQAGIRWVSPGGVIAVLLWVAASAIFGSPGMSVDHPGLGSWGRRRVIGPQESITRASAAWAEWNP